MPKLVKRYSAPDDSGNNVSPVEDPREVLTQMYKLVHSLTLGVFVNPFPSDSISNIDLKYCTTLRMFKHVVGWNHVDFCMGQQQDTEHYIRLCPP